MATVTFISKYRKNGNLVYMYTLDGTKEELALYKQAKGSFYREGSEGKAKGKALVYTTLTVFGESCEVEITPKGNVVEAGFIEGEALIGVADRSISKVKSNSLQDALAKKFVTTGQLGVTKQLSNIAPRTVVEENTNAAVSQPAVVEEP